MVDFAAPAPPPLPPPADEAAPAQCGNHPDHPGRYHCTNGDCGFIGCSACVKMRVSQTSRIATPWCWKCGERVLEMQSHEELRKAIGPPFYRDLPAVFRYPFHSEGVYIFIGAVVMWAVCSMFGLLGLFFRLLLMIYPLQVIRETVKGEARPPEFADLFDPTTLSRIIKLLLFYLVYLLPTIAGIVLRAEAASLFLIGLLQIAVWMAQPMGLAILAEHEGWLAAVSPYHVIREIAKVPREYGIMLAIDLPIIIAKFVMGFMLSNAFPFNILISAMAFYFDVVVAHILGRILRERQDVLTWVG